MSHSIVKQQLASPWFLGNAKYNQGTSGCKGFTPSLHLPDESYARTSIIVTLMTRPRPLILLSFIILVV